MNIYLLLKASSFFILAIIIWFPKPFSQFLYPTLTWGPFLNFQIFFRGNMVPNLIPPNNMMKFTLYNNESRQSSLTSYNISISATWNDFTNCGNFQFHQYPLQLFQIIQFLKFLQIHHWTWSTCVTLCKTSAINFYTCNQ